MDLRGRENSFATRVSESVPPQMKSFGGHGRKWGAVFYDQLMKGGSEASADKKHVKSLLGFLMEKTILELLGNTDSKTIAKHLRPAKALAYADDYSKRYGRIEFGKPAKDQGVPFILR
ncbi:hypothetical protein SAMN06295888_10287 [Desulfonatronum zhilinae]|nr:hypothetical protein SAMN06295888_10287 [Desulfonatronum zhilinae]